MMTDDEKQWTRLIDGELSFSEQRSVLATLDDTPNGWRRLALGLLEAEAFRRELRNYSPSQPFAVTEKSISQRPGLRRGLRAAMVCAIGLICLGLGMGIEHYRQPVAVVVDQPIPVATTFATDDVQTRQTMKLVFADGPAGGQSVEVPVIEAAEVEAMNMLRQSAVPDELRRKLEAQGYVIHEERTYVPVSLANGRQGIAPVSDVVVEQRPVVFQ